MEIWLWVSVCIMAVIIIILLVKIHIMHISCKEICIAFSDRLTTDTNTLIDISGRDKYMRKLASSINLELRRLRTLRNHYRLGDNELKNAVTNISHDLRTPLTAICGYLDLLEQEDKSENAERYLMIIRNRSNILIELTEELFRYSVILTSENEAVKDREDLSIGDILEESIAAFYTSLSEKGIVPDIYIPEQKVVRNLNRSSLTRIFSNLINNAIKYSDGDLEIRLTEAGEVIFTNTAADISEVQVGRLFDRFYTVEAARNSTGLGLSIARALVGQMGGTISADYQNGKLSIHVIFPIP